MCRKRNIVNFRFQAIQILSSHRFLTSQKQHFVTFRLRHTLARHDACSERPLFGHTGLWRFPEKAVGAACLDVRFQLFRTVTFDTLQSVAISKSRPST
jgi:hypothetical protein